MTRHLHETLLPWHESLWPAVMEQSQKSGGLLLSGPSGHGKHHLARRLSMALLCESPLTGGHPCGACPSCLLARANQHPDWVEIVTEKHWDDFVRLRTEGGEGGADEGAASPGGDADEKGKKAARDIRIVDIRRLERLTTLTSHRGGRRVVLIWPADDMTTEASNALLKTLEEPGEGLHFILVAAHAARVLPTIRSRVRVQHCPPASMAQAQAWLKSQGLAQPDVALGLSTGAPLQALKLSEASDGADDGVTARDAFVRWLLDPQSASASERPAAFDKLGFGNALNLMVLTASELLRCAHGADLQHFAFLQAQIKPPSGMDTSALHRLVRQCLNFLPNADHPVNVKMQLDALLQDWFNALYRRAA